MQLLADSQDDLTGVKGFCDKIAGAQFKSEHAVQFGVPRCKNDQGQRVSRGFLSQDLAKFEPVHLREVKVQQNEGRGRFPDLDKRLLRVASALNAIAGRLKMECHNLERLLFVIDDEDLRFHRSS